LFRTQVLSRMQQAIKYVENIISFAHSALHGGSFKPTITPAPGRRRKKPAGHAYDYESLSRIRRVVACHL
jgi:hypothetical protein